MPAKIRPTSPRGIMPMPTAMRFVPRPKAPTAHASLPASAQWIRTASKLSTVRLARPLRSTWAAHQHEEKRHKEA
jgi:hypothetical protein